MCPSHPIGLYLRSSQITAALIDVDRTGDRSCAAILREFDCLLGWLRSRGFGSVDAVRYYRIVYSNFACRVFFWRGSNCRARLRRKESRATNALIDDLAPRDISARFQIWRHASGTNTARINYLVVWEHQSPAVAKGFDSALTRVIGRQYQIAARAKSFLQIADIASLPHLSLLLRRADS